MPSVALVLVAAGCGFGGKNEGEQIGGAIVGMTERASLTAGAANLQQWYQSHGTYAGGNPGVPV